MCFHTKQSKSAQELEHRFKAKVSSDITPTVYNGFEHPKTPVILNNNPSIIENIEWGLIPSWAKDISIQKSTLNAKIESIREKTSFKNCIEQKCLIIADGFFEWQWLDDKGKEKQKYLLKLANDELFAFAGLWNEWTNPVTGEKSKTYTILTTEANDLTRKIHNSKMRMPVIIAKENEIDWLEGKFLRIQNQRLIAERV